MINGQIVNAVSPIGEEEVCNIGLDRYRYGYRVSADTHQYLWVSVSADTYFSIGADTSRPVICLPVSTVNTVATHAYSFKPIPYFRTYIPHTYVTCTHLYPTQNRIFSTKFCTAWYRYWYRYRCSCSQQYWVSGACTVSV